MSAERLSNHLNSPVYMSALEGTEVDSTLKTGAAVPPNMTPVNQDLIDALVSAYEEPFLKAKKALEELSLEQTHSDEEESKASSHEPPAKPSLPPFPNKGWDDLAGSLWRWDWEKNFPQMKKPWNEMSSDDKIAYVKECLDFLNKMKSSIPVKGSDGLAEKFYWKNVSTELDAQIKTYEKLLLSLKMDGYSDPFSGINLNIKIPKFDFKPGQGPTMGESAAMAAALSEILSQLAQILGLAGKGRTDAQKTLADANLEQTQRLLEISSKTVEKIQEQIEKAKNASLFQKIFGFITTGLTAIAALAAGQVLIAATTVALGVLSATGKMQEAVDALASELEKIPNMSAATAKALASSMITAAIIIINIGGTAALSKCTGVLKSLASGSGKTLAIAGVVSGIQSIQQTGMINAIAVASVRKEDQQAFETAMQVILGIIEIIATVALGDAGSATGLPDKIKKIASGATTLSSIGQSASTIARGAIELEMADNQLSLKTTNTLAEFARKLSQSASAQFKNDSKHMGDEVRAILAGINELIESKKEADNQLAEILAGTKA